MKSSEALHESKENWFQGKGERLSAGCYTLDNDPVDDLFKALVGSGEWDSKNTYGFDEVAAVISEHRDIILGMVDVIVLVSVEDDAEEGWTRAGLEFGGDGVSD